MQEHISFHQFPPPYILTSETTRKQGMVQGMTQGKLLFTSFCSCNNTVLWRTTLSPIPPPPGDSATFSSAKSRHKYHHCFVRLWLMMLLSGPRSQGAAASHLAAMRETTQEFWCGCRKFRYCGRQRDISIFFYWNMS